eukprot:624160-Pelagomonas_calceolata.AAC.4
MSSLSTGCEKRLSDSPLSASPTQYSYPCVCSLALIAYGWHAGGSESNAIVGARQEALEVTT